jgi:hypothetical protein
MLFRLCGGHKNFDGGRDRKEVFLIMKKNNLYLLGMLALVLAFGTVLAACSKKDSGEGAASWEKALNEYEAFVDEYVVFMKKFSANPGDAALLGEYTSMLERAEKAADSIAEVEDNLSGADLEKFTNRYMKISEKITTALQ